MVKGLNKPLFTIQAIQGLSLVQRVTVLGDKVSTPVDHFPCLFHGLGKQQRDYAIKLQEGAKPFAISTPCMVIILLLKLVNTSSGTQKTVKVNKPTKITCTYGHGAKCKW